MFKIILIISLLLISNTVFSYEKLINMSPAMNVISQIVTPKGSKTFNTIKALWYSESFDKIISHLDKKKIYPTSIKKGKGENKDDYLVVFDIYIIRTLGLSRYKVGATDPRNIAQLIRHYGLTGKKIDCRRRPGNNKLLKCHIEMLTKGGVLGNPYSVYLTYK